MTHLSQFRKNLAVLSTFIAEEAGVSASSVGKYIARDPKFFSSCQEKDFRVGTYDYVIARFSAICPEHLAWPKDIERPAASEIDPETRDWFLPRFKPRDKAAASVHAEWPADQPWPEDIAKPETATNG
jgi:hypothetical protein